MKNHLKKIKEDFKIHPKKEKSFKDFLNQMRILKEEHDSKTNKKSVYDQSSEEDKFMRILPSDAVVNFEELEVYDDLVIWGGRINDDFDFFYQVTPSKKTSYFDFNFLSGFDPVGAEKEGDEEGDEYVENQMELFDSVKNYYNTFSNYWRDELNI